MSPKDWTAVGRPLPRPEDRRLLIGAGRFVDDIAAPGALCARFVRSPHAHARILAIDTEAARAAPGVVSAVTGKELAEWTTPYRMAPPIEGLLPSGFPTLPLDRVRFNGDPVACVVATDRYLAEDAAELVVVDFEPLDAVAGIDAALAEGAPLVDETLPSNLISHQSFTTGDLDAAFAGAVRVVECTFRQGRQTHLPIEPRACLAVWDAGREHLTFHTAAQAPHPLRTQLAARLRLDESQVSVKSGDVGGGFGQKIPLYREELTVAALARALGRPVRWTEDRMENLLASNHAREQVVTTRAAVDAAGRVLGLEMGLIEDFGAYCFYPANYLARVVGMILTGPYRIRSYAYDVRVVLTNKCGSGPMRAPMSITSWVMEGTLNAVARELGLDPIEVRRANMITADDLPHRMPTGEVLEDVTPRETMEAAVKAVDYAAFRHRQAEDRARGVYRGLGVCVVIESTTYGSAFYKSAGIPGSGHEAAWVRIEPSGAVNASAGLGPTGQGYEMPFAQAVAEGLGVDPARVRVHLGDTDVAPYGMGSRGSRGGTAGGGALYLAAQEANRKVLAISAGMLNLNTADELRMRDGRIERHQGGAWTESGIGLADVARRAYLDPLNLPAGMEPGLIFHKAYDPPPMTYSNSTHACEVVVDAETGRVTIERYLIAEDCGTVLNPLVVEGQQHGATAMGIGGTLYEEVVYDESGQNLSGTLADYLVPTACEIPDFEIIPMHTPNRKGPLGIKGMAEGGVMGAVGAVSLAVGDALGPFGVRAESQPFTPERVRMLIRGRASGTS